MEFHDLYSEMLAFLARHPGFPGRWKSSLKPHSSTIKFVICLILMNQIDLRRADLNLLFVFHVLLAERHVGRAAKRRGLSQPAGSHALGRLRILFEDPLFVRHPKGVEPTARALALAPAVADVLN